LYHGRFEEKGELVRSKVESDSKFKTVKKKGRGSVTISRLEADRQ